MPNLVNQQHMYLDIMAHQSTTTIDHEKTYITPHNAK
jgi:hypothetical protein